MNIMLHLYYIIIILNDILNDNNYIEGNWKMNYAFMSKLGLIDMKWLRVKHHLLKNKILVLLHNISFI